MKPPQIPGYRVLEVGAIILKGDYINNKEHEGLLEELTPAKWSVGELVESDDLGWYYRPIEPSHNS